MFRKCSGVFLFASLFAFVATSGSAAESKAGAAPRARIIRYLMSGSVSAYVLRCPEKSGEDCELSREIDGRAIATAKLPRQRAVSLLKEYLKSAAGRQPKPRGRILLEWEVRCDGVTSAGRNGRSQVLPEPLGSALALLEAEFSSALTSVPAPEPSSPSQAEK